MGKRHHEICGVIKRTLNILWSDLNSRGSEGVVMDGDLSLLPDDLRDKGTTQANPDRHVIAFTCYNTPSRS